MMSEPFVPALLLLTTLVALLFIRSRSIAAKVTAETVLLVTIGACLVARGTSPLPGLTELAVRPDSAWLRALAVVWWLIAARLIATGTVVVLGRDVRSRQARLFSDLLAGAIYLTAVLIILNSVLDLPIKGLLATSGVIAIVLGLALQNSLADLFAGIAVGLEQPFHVGDRVTIGDHAEGIVVQMNWRSIRIQTDSEDLATIPNSIVAKSQIINRSVPTERRAASVEISTSSTASSQLLSELIRQAILLCPAILTDPAPSIRIRHVGTRTTTFSVGYFVANTPTLSVARGELLWQVRRLFRHAGVQDATPLPNTSLLQNLALFESLATDQVAQIAKDLLPHRFDPGAVLFEQGSVGASLYIIRSGIFEISQTNASGMLRRYGRIGPGEYLGEISMMSGDPRPVRVTALTSGEVLELPRKALESLIMSDGRLAEALEASVQRGLAQLDRDEAARDCHPLDTKGSLLARIRNFLRAPRAFS
ncbi:mechanosensitive ion channel family protein [Sphingomonas sp. PR090111-T3T-6A]|uniref:mechanosensitive ion channel family protein n=1 Tax=Sphingomonas sp. PR090111-T3T-6A TaxID=685778 RepID=UPI0003644AD5|nr:mechanosensitive ion channel family protein [Sphingomonas sp. PR090111-T3T-6A]